MSTIYKILQIAIKLCSLAITIPVTIETAGLLFAEVPVVYRVIVQLSAVILVELTLLASWLALENDKGAPTAVKVRHALTALGLYIGLTGLAVFVHREGFVAGLLFRFAMLAALLGSIYDSGVYTVLQGQRQTERNAMKAWRVKRYYNKLAVRDAIAQLDVDFAIKDKQRAQAMQEETSRLDKDHQAIMATIRKDRAIEPEIGAGRYPMPIDQARALGSAKNAARKRQALSMIAGARALNPDITRKEMSQLTGVSRNTIGSWLAEEERRQNGNGHQGETEQ